MKKLLLVITALTCFTFSLTAQKAKELPALGVTPFYSNGQDDLELSKELYEAVTRRLIQSKRFKVIDIPKRENAQTELQNMKHREFIEREILEVGKSTPAEYLMVGFIRNSEQANANSGAEARIDVEVKYIDVQTGEAIAAESFKGTSLPKIEAAAETGKQILKATIKKKNQDMAEVANAASNAPQILNVSSTKGKVIDAIDDMADQLFKWVLQTSESNLYFIKVEGDDTAENVDYILIEGGQDIGLEEGLKLRMVLDEKVISSSGNTVLNEDPIANLKITDVRSHTSVCKVTKKQIDNLKQHLSDSNLRIMLKWE